LVIGLVDAVLTNSNEIRVKRYVEISGKCSQSFTKPCALPRDVVLA
jgi:hypothetical protein